MVSESSLHLFPLYPLRDHCYHTVFNSVEMMDYFLWLKLIHTRDYYVEIRRYFLNRRCQLIVLSANAANSGGVVS